MGPARGLPLYIGRYGGPAPSPPDAPPSFLRKQESIPRPTSPLWVPRLRGHDVVPPSFLRSLSSWKRGAGIHPGPISPLWVPACAGTTTPSIYIVIQVCPERIVLLNQLNLPCPPPPLDRLLSADGAFHQFMNLVPDEVVNSVALGKPIHQVVLVEPDSLDDGPMLRRYTGSR